MYRKYLFVIGTISLLLLTCAVSFSCTAANTTEFSYTAIIPQGGYHKSQELEMDEGDKVIVEAKVNRGGSVDLYLMTYTQFTVSYGEDRYNTEKTISYLKADENINTGKASFKVPDRDDQSSFYDLYEYFESLFVIIDNRNSSLTLNDANSVGPVEVTVKVKIEHDDIPIFDPFTIGCIIMVVVILVIIIIIIIVMLRSSRKKEAQRFKGFPYQYQYTPKPGQGGQGYYQYPYWPPPPPDEGEKHKENKKKKRKTRYDL